MHLSPVDWLILVAYLVLAGVTGVYFSRRGSRSVNDFFLAGRTLPWWLAGLTMVASAFSIDTPMGITGLVAKDGIQGVWYAWAFVLGGAGTLGAFIFASLLRRSEVITTAELVELRYDGRAAAGLRLFKSFYFGILSNAISLGGVIKGVWTVTEVVLGWNPHITLATILLVTVSYSALSGLWGITATDVLQFLIGLSGLLVLMVFALRHVGGVDGLIDGFTARYGAEEAARRLQFFPRWGSPFFETFVVFVTLKWWSNPPSAIHQRIVASKNEKHASFATLVFCILQFAVNYWPMILIAMASLVAYPQLAEPERGYPMLIVELLPAGFLGLVLAAMMAAFMSTVDTHINYGAAYMVNDVYRRFLKPNEPEHHYVRAARFSTVLMLLIAVGVAYSLDSVNQAWYYLATLTAGYGFLTIIRWFWWRINAWGEIASLAASGIASTLATSRFARLAGYEEFLADYSYGWRFLFVMLTSTAAWLIVTFLTPPTSEVQLARFCRKVKPFPAFWGPIYKKYPDIDWNPNFLRATLHWIFGSIAVYGLCFGIGNLIFGATLHGWLLLAMTAVILGVIARTWRA